MKKLLKDIIVKFWIVGILLLLPFFAKAQYSPPTGGSPMISIQGFYKKIGNDTLWWLRSSSGLFFPANRIPTSRTLTIFGTTQDLSANRTFTAANLINGYGIASLSYNGSSSLSIIADTASSTGLVSKGRLATNLTGYLQTSVISGLANPTTTIGLTAVNGSATTAMRSDAAPALSQAITPNWTGLHTYNAGIDLATGSTAWLGIGSNPLSYAALYVPAPLSGSVTGYGMYLTPTIGSGMTASYYGIRSLPNTQAASFSTNVIHFSADAISLGSGSSVNINIGFSASAAMTQGANNRGFEGDVVSGANNYNLYMSGSAQNYLAGNTGIGISPGTNTLTIGGQTIINGNSGGTTTALQFQNAGTNNGFIGSEINAGGVASNFMAYAYGNNSYSIWTNGTKRLNIDGSGNALFGNTISTGTATPLTVSLGGTASTNAVGSPANLKLLIYQDATNKYGIGVNQTGLMEYQTGAGGSMSFYTNGSTTASLNLDAGGNALFNGIVNIKDGFNMSKGASNTIGNGTYITFDNALTATSQRQMTIQLNSSSGLDLWYYNGSGYSQTGINFANSGLITSSQIRSGTNNSLTKGTGSVADASISGIQSVFSTNSSSGFQLGIYSYAEQTAATTGSIQALEGQAFASHTSGTVALMLGTVGNIQVNGSGGTTTWARSVQAGGAITAGTVTNWARFYAGAGSGSAGANYSFYGEPNAGIGYFADGISTLHLIGNSGTPTIAAGSGAGTSPTLSVTGTDLGGTISITTGTSPGGAGSYIATITFNTAYSLPPRAVIIMPSSPNAAALTGSNAQPFVPGLGSTNEPTTTTFTIQANGTGLTASTTYTWSYMVIQ